MDPISKWCDWNPLKCNCNWGENPTCIRTYLIAINTSKFNKKPTNDCKPCSNHRDLSIQIGYKHANKRITEKKQHISIQKQRYSIERQRTKNPELLRFNVNRMSFLLFNVETMSKIVMPPEVSNIVQCLHSLLDFFFSCLIFKLKEIKFICFLHLFDLNE